MAELTEQQIEHFSRMNDIKKGDIVVRKSYGKDIIFRVIIIWSLETFMNLFLDYFPSF